MSKKDIDKLFQEKLKDFREIPHDRVWNSIQNSLDQRKKSRRALPIWWRLGGVAAILAIALLFYGPFGNDTAGTTITDRDDAKPVINSETPQEKDILLKDASESDGLVEDSSSEKPDSRVLEDDSKLANSPSSSQLAETSGSNKESKASGSKKITKEEAVLANNAKENNNTTETEISKIELEREYETLAQNQPVENIGEQTQAVRMEEDINKASVYPEKKDPIDISATEVTQQSVEESTEDSSGKKSIFDEINKQEEEVLAENQGAKWSVGPSIAPVYFNSFGEGSPIHTNFVSNSKSGNVNLSYGVAVGYEISDKLKIRSGVHKVDYGYDTNDISFSSSLVASTSTQITNIDYTNTSRSLVVESGSEPQSSEQISANDIIAPSPSRSGNMVQEFGYIEVPLELNYSLLDRKVNIELIGGVSSLFLVNNTVTLESEGASTEMGEANNINDVNFSTNIGLGVNYELSNTMKVHLEPMFKYQLNTFSGTEGSFQPYSLGVYTGLSFKF